MAATDILSLRTSMGERLIRLLYGLALLLIALAVLFGIGRGVFLMTRAPIAPPAVSANANPNPPQVAPQAPAPQAAPQPQGPRPGFRGMRGGPRFYGRFDRRRFFIMRAHPVRSGIFLVIVSLFRGMVALLVVRILAEMGLAVLAMPRRT